MLGLGWSYIQGGALIHVGNLHLKGVCVCGGGDRFTRKVLSNWARDVLLITYQAC